MQPPDAPPKQSAQLSVWDAVSIIIGIVVGVTIFKPSFIYDNVSSPWIGLGAWALGGALSFIGALCYAELATTYPRRGGDYVYLTRAFGPLVGFLFGWAQLAAILTGSTGQMAYVFADYAVPLANVQVAYKPWIAVGAVLALTAINLLGVVIGKAAQNLLTVVKVAGLVMILFAGLAYGSAAVTGSGDVAGPGFGLAMVLVLYAYGGWNDAAFVAAEVRDRRRNVPLALLFGTLAITALYMLVNVAYLRGLGFHGLRDSSTPAAAVLDLVAGEKSARLISLLVMTSALGAMNGLIFTGSRVYASLGADYGIFALLGRWHPRWNSPVWALAAQAAITAVMILAVGTDQGRATVDAVLIWAGFGAIPWNQYQGGFETLLASTAPVFWSFFLLTGLSLFVLRDMDRGVERPFHVPLYPFVPIVFCLTCAYMLYSAVAYAKALTFLGLGPFIVGIPLYCLPGRKTGSSASGAM